MKLSDAAKRIVSVIAPTVGAAIGGPLGPVAGRILGELVGGDDKAVERKLLAGDPQALAAVKTAEAKLTERLAELGVDLEQLANQDRADARARQVALKDHTPAILAFVVVGGFFGCVLYILRYGVPDNGGEALLVLLGALAAAFGSVVAYYYGSSSGSKKKTEELAAIARLP